MKVLVVEDEPRIAELVSRGLEGQGFVVEIAPDGMAGLSAALRDDTDLMILDLNLPLLSGEELLDRLGSIRPDLPVIILSAKDGVEDRVRNLDAGADDYLTKPFSVAELLARVQARLRDRKPPADPTLEHGRVRLDVHARAARIDGRDVELTTREFDLLEALMRHPTQVLAHGQLLSLAWGDDDRPASNVIEVYIRHLRQKLDASVIETVRGAGYRFVG